MEATYKETLLDGTITDLFTNCVTHNHVLSTEAGTTRVLSATPFTHQEALGSIEQTLFFDHSSQEDSHKSRLFGFHKLAILLSPREGRLFGMDTAGPHKGEVVWRLLIPRNAQTHVMVHGSASSKSSVNGAFSSHKKNDSFLLLSVYQQEVKWTCVDGITGIFHKKGSLAVSTPKWPF